MSLFYCGFNGFGQLTTSDFNILEEFTLYPIERVEDAAFSWSNIIVSTHESEVFITGLVNDKSNTTKKLQLNIDEKTKSTCCTAKDVQELKITKVTCSANSECSEHSLLLTTRGECWLYSDSLGLKKIPSFVATENSDADLTGEDYVVKLCCGNIVNLAVSLRGNLYSIPSLLPLSGVKVTDVACGFEHNLVLTDRGSVFSWGSGSRGQLGHGSLDDVESPTQLAALSNASCIGAGGWHSCVVTPRGLYSWGWNSEGQLGLRGTTQGAEEATQGAEEAVNVAAEPMRVQTEVQVKQVACGNRHTVVLADDGSVWGCGWNGKGQLARPGVTANVFGLTRLDLPSGSVRRVLAGAWSTAVIMDSRG